MKLQGHEPGRRLKLLGPGSNYQCGKSYKPVVGLRASYDRGISCFVKHKALRQDGIVPLPRTAVVVSMEGLRVYAWSWPKIR